MINSFKSNFDTTPKFFKIGTFLVGLVLLIVGFFLGRSTAPTAVAAQPDSITPTATQTLNKQFAFNLKNDKGENAGQFQYVISTAELDNQIILQGQKASAVKGRAFLVINLKITNSNNQNIQINTRDYIRLSTNGSKELLAPEIHNDPVEVQANSTKLTRVGFPINQSDKNLQLIVGEITGPKTNINLSLH